MAGKAGTVGSTASLSEGGGVTTPIGKFIRRQTGAGISYILAPVVDGFVLAVPANVPAIVLNPPLQIASGTLTLPDKPVAGQAFFVKTTKSITALQLKAPAGQLIAIQNASLPAGGRLDFMFEEITNTWV